ncbi:MAG: hypothetical protein KatS3mg050_2727 [Litorilinea sp.]|nr:MAG: hypothetical protein KatS3mg050_2727 [Litorilinea sp.]
MNSPHVVRFLRNHWLLGIVIVVYFLLATLYALAIPPFEGQDAPAHFTATVYYRSGLRMPEITPDAVAVYGYELLVQPPLYHLLAGLATKAWPSEPSLQFAKDSYNRYLQKGLSYRQSVVLPQPNQGALTATWVARFISLLGGLLTLVSTWWWIQILFPGKQWLAGAATAVVAYNPEFIYLSTSITNDAWSAGAAAFVLALSTWVVLHARKPQSWLWVGAALGIASLTKYNTLLTGLPIGILWLLYWRQRGARHAWIGGIWGSLGFFAVAGWWFTRNFLLYGEPIPMNILNQIVGLRRPEPYDLETTLSYIPWLLASFWGVFLAVVIPGWSLDLIRWFMGIGILGFLASLGFTRNLPGPRRLILYVAIPLYLLVVAGSVLYWTSTVNFGEQGRLGFVGLAAFGLVMAWGWIGWLPKQWQPLLAQMVIGFMLVLAITGWMTAREAFALPSPMPSAFQPTRPVDAHFEGGMHLVGSDFPQGGAGTPGDVLPFVLYWNTATPIQDDYTLFIHLVDEQGNKLFQFDGVPVQGRHPTRQWRPGEVFSDPYLLQIPDSATPGVASLWIGFYALDTEERVPVYSPDRTLLGGEILLARIRITDTPLESQPLEHEKVAQWANGIYLRDVTVTWDAAGEPKGLTLAWSTTQTLHKDYRVFLHIVDAQGHILAQVDGEPQHGLAPTSTWRSGEQIRDTITWEAQTPSWSSILVGLYDPITNERLAVLEPPVEDNAIPLVKK